MSGLSVFVKKKTTLLTMSVLVQSPSLMLEKWSITCAIKVVGFHWKNTTNNKYKDKDKSQEYSWDLSFRDGMYHP
jgi:hypothetical protein